MKREKCIYCVDYVNYTDAWEDDHGVLHYDIHIQCGVQFNGTPEQRAYLSI